MGGFGSGTWTRWGSKRTVEELLSLDIRRMSRMGLLVPDSDGRLAWSGENRRPVAFAEYFFGPDLDDRIHLTLRGAFGSFGGSDHVFVLHPTQPHFGGRRWWFACPGCDGRVAKLYWDSPDFRCRRCAGLTYQSCKTAHQIERGRRMMGKLMDGLKENP